MSQPSVPRLAREFYEQQVEGKPPDPVQLILPGRRLA